MAETANVDVLINAFTEAAEESLEDVGDELAGLGADGEIAQSVLNEVGDELNNATGDASVAGEAFDDLSGDAGQLAAMMALLDSRANSAGNELLQTGGKASATSGIFSGLSLNVGALSFSFMGLSATIWAVLLPALAVLLTTLAPIIALLGGAVTAAGAFAVAAGGFVATGIVTEMEMLREALAEAGAEIRNIIEPMGELAGSILLKLIERLPQMVRETMEAVGGMGVFASQLETLAITVMDLVPGMVGFAVALAEDVAPAIAAVIEFLEGSGPGLVESFFATFEELEPGLREFGGALLDMLPVLLDFGTNVLSILLPALESLTRGATRLMARTDFASVRDGLSVLSDAIDTVAPKFALFANRAIELGLTLAPIAAEYVPFVAKATRQLFDLMGALIGVTNGAIEALGPNGLHAAVILLGGALAVLGGPVSLVVGAIAVAAASVPLLTNALNALAPVAKSVGATLVDVFTNQLPGMLIMGFSVMTALLTKFANGVYNILIGGFNKAAVGVAKILQAIVDRFNGMIETVNDAIEFANERLDMDMGTFETLERLEINRGRLPEQVDNSDPTEQVARRQAEAIAAELNLNVEGDGPLAEWLDEQASVKQDERSAQQDRYQRRNNIGSNPTR